MLVLSRCQLTNVFWVGIDASSGVHSKVSGFRHPYRNGFVFDDLVNCGFVGTALVFSHFARNLTGTHGFLEKPYVCLYLAPDSQQK